MKKILKKLVLCSTILCAIIFITACGKNTIVGTWNYYKDGKVTDNIYYTFEKGNKGSYTYGNNIYKFTYEDRGNKVVIKYENNTKENEFEYSIKDGILTIKDSFGSDVLYKRK